MEKPDVLFIKISSTSELEPVHKRTVIKPLVGFQVVLDAK